MKINFKELIIRTIATMAVVFITAKLTPFFEVGNGLMSLFWAALSISIVQYVIVGLLGFGKSRTAQAGTGFLTTAVILYLAGMVSDSISITIVGALIGALLIGIVDAIIPGGRL